MDAQWYVYAVGTELWRAVDSELWEQTRNPWLLLQLLTNERLDELCKDRDFCHLVGRHAALALEVQQLLVDDARREKLAVDVDQRVVVEAWRDVDELAVLVEDLAHGFLPGVLLRHR